MLGLGGAREETNKLALHGKCRIMPMNYWRLHELFILERRLSNVSEMYSDMDLEASLRPPLDCLSHFLSLAATLP